MFFDILQSAASSHSVNRQCGRPVRYASGMYPICIRYREIQSGDSGLPSSSVPVFKEGLSGHETGKERFDPSRG